MKKILLPLVLSFALIISFNACEEDDDKPAESTNTTSNTGGSGNGGPGSGGGAGTGGGTGSMGIPANSMKAKINGNWVEFQLVQGSVLDTMIVINGNPSITTDFPQLTISMPISTQKDTFTLVAGLPPKNQPTFTCGLDSLNNGLYFPFNGSGQIVIRNIDTSRSLVNGVFEGQLINFNTPPDTLRIDSGQFNKFYN